MIVELASTLSMDVWKQERTIIHAPAGDAVKFWTNLHGSSAAPIATYSTLTDGAYIDVTDYMRTYGSNVTSLKFEQGASSYTISVSVKGLINPASVIIPPFALLSSAALSIIPPSRLIAPIGNNGLRIGIYGTNSFTVTNGIVDENDVFTQATDGMTLASTTTVFTLAKSRTTPGGTDVITDLRYYKVVPQQCDVRYAMVRWESFTGATRCHTMEVAKVKTEVANAYSLAPIDNEYINIKGREDGFTLRLTGLSAYDLWYYSDIITSSKVEVSLDGTNWQRVEVSTKSITQPDGEGSDGKIAINVNWKRYDAVAM